MQDGRLQVIHDTHTGRASIHNVRHGVQRSTVGVESPTDTLLVDGEQTSVRHQVLQYLPNLGDVHLVILSLLARGVVQPVTVLIAGT